MCSFFEKVDSFLTPMISSVQSFQTTIKNAPDNVIGMVKGISDNLLPTNPTTLPPPMSSNANNTNNPTMKHSNSINQISSNSALSSSALSSSTSSKGVNHIERTILNGDDLVIIFNYFKTIIMEIFFHLKF